MRKLSILALLFYSIVVLAQQEQLFTQYMYNKLGINPAFAGNEDYLGLTAQLRDQYNGFPGAPEVQHLSVNLPKIGRSIGLGVNMRRRSIGVAQELNIGGIYAYKFPLSFGMLSTGMEFSFRNRLMDFTSDKLVASEGLSGDPSIPNQKITQNLFNIGAGVYLSAKQYFLGVSVPRLIKNELDYDKNIFISREVRHLFVMGGGTIKLLDDLDLNLQTLMKFAENSPFDTDITAGLTLDNKYSGSIGYRLGGGEGDVGESVAIILSFQLTDQFMVAFSQDFTLSDIRKYDNGSFELVTSYAFGKKNKRPVLLNPRYF